MSDEATRLFPAFEEIKQHAEAENVEIDPSFFVELGNYSRHAVVCELPNPDLHRVLVGLGRVAIVGGDRKVGAGRVRQVITQLCTDPFSSCDLAARRILEESPQGRSEVRGSGGSFTGNKNRFFLPEDPFSRLK